MTRFFPFAIFSVVGRNSISFSARTLVIIAVPVAVALFTIILIVVILLFCCICKCVYMYIYIYTNTLLSIYLGNTLLVLIVLNHTQLYFALIYYLSSNITICKGYEVCVYVDLGYTYVHCAYYLYNVRITYNFAVYIHVQFS